MRRRMGVLAVVLLLIILFTGEAVSAKPICGATTKYVVTRVGDEFKITFMNVCTDGAYLWRLSRQVGTAGIELVKEEYFPDAPYLCGSPVTQVFTFKAVRTGVKPGYIGTAGLTFEYRRSRESPINKADYTVFVLPAIR